MDANRLTADLGGGHSRKSAAAIVTGAGSGIGRATSFALADSGALVYIVDRDLDGGLATERGIRERGGTATFLEADVTSSGDVDQIVARAAQGGSRQGGLRILVNAAGMLHQGLEELSADDVGLSIDVNVKGTFYFCRAVAPHMLAAGSGVIINVASSAATREFPPEWPAYVAGKTAVVGLTRSLANRLRPGGVAVFAVSPGMVATPMGARAFEDYYGREPTTAEFERVLDPGTVARIVLALTQPEMRYASGTIVEIDEVGVSPLPDSRPELDRLASESES
jgi:NAD(P)-dependent dehydrogenase (short-subunit alcohol dehydrogenase family)